MVWFVAQRRGRTSRFVLPLAASVLAVCVAIECLEVDGADAQSAVTGVGLGVPLFVDSGSSSGGGSSSGSSSGGGLGGPYTCTNTANTNPLGMPTCVYDSKQDVAFGQWKPVLWTDGGPLDGTGFAVGPNCLSAANISYDGLGGVTLINDYTPDASCTNRFDGGVVHNNYTGANLQMAAQNFGPPVTFFWHGTFPQSGGSYGILWAFNAPCQTPNILMSNPTYGNTTCAPRQEEEDFFEAFPQAVNLLDRAFHLTVNGSVIINFNADDMNVTTTTTHWYAVTLAQYPYPGSDAGFAGGGSPQILLFVDGVLLHGLISPNIPTENVFPMMMEMTFESGTTSTGTMHFDEMGIFE